MATQSFSWSKIESDPRFQALHRKKTVFLWSLMAFSVIYYFALPVGAAYFTELFTVKLWGAINFGLLFALSEFLVAWGIAYVYAKKASEFDAMADVIVKDARNIGT